MATEKEVVSVIIPTYYRNDRVSDAVESALAQTYEPVEVIVVDDSGEGHARPVAEQYDVTYISHETNRGANAARETGIHHSSGRYVQLLDDDDRLYKSKLLRQVAVLEDTPHVGVVYCGADIDGETVLPDPSVRGNVLEHALRIEMWPCVTSSMLIDRDVLERIRPLQSRVAMDDVPIKIRLAQTTEFDFVDAPLISKSRHETNKSQRPEAYEQRFQIVREYAPVYREQGMYGRLSESYRRDSWNRLREDGWSLTAIVSSFRACYYMARNRDVDAKTAGLALASLFGNSGYRLAQSVYSMNSR